MSASFQPFPPCPQDAGSQPGFASLLREDERALLPFLAWAQPFFVARQERVLDLLEKLAAKYPQRFMPVPLRDCVRAAFAAPLLNWLARTLVLELGIARHQQLLEGNSPEARFADFVNYLGSTDGRRYLNRTYPLLRKNLMLRSKQVERSLSALLRHVARDFPRLQDFHGSASGPLQSFKTQMGDRHADGGSVARLQFQSALLYYKPRSMALDAAWESLLAWLVREGVHPRQRAARVLDCGTYGYAADVPWQAAENEADLQQYYQRFGGLVALAYALGTTDLHHENLVASGAWPVIIDTETLFQPAHVAPGSPGRAAFADTVIYSGLLPHGTQSGEHSDTTALFMPDKALYSRVPSDAGTDQMRLTMQQVTLPFAANMPRLDGEVVAPHRYVEAICAGFDLTYCALSARKAALLAETGPLAAFRQAQVRAILRPTQVYALLLTWLSHPDYQRNSVQCENLLARLRPEVGEAVGRKRGGGQTSAKRQSAMLACWESEREALLRGDVPHFSARVDSCTLQDERGLVIEGVFAASGWQEAERNLRRLSPADHLRQRRLLHEAVASTAPLVFAAESHAMAPAPRPAPVPAPVPAAAPAFEPAQFVQEAVRIGDHILSQAMGSSAHPVYYQLEMRGHEVLRPFPLRGELYDGLSGLALFYAQLAHCSGLPRFARAAKATLASVRREYESMQSWPDDCGAFSGLAGWLYTLAFVGLRLQRTQWIDEAFACLPQLERQIGQDRQFDVVAGCAGALLVLLELERVAPGRGALEVARLCATHLQECAMVDERGACWIGAAHPEHALGGFSHGTIGIACALARYASLTGDAALMALVREALRFERSAFDPETGLWRDLRADRCEHAGQAGSVYAWCHGAPGIGLGLLALPPALHDAQWQQDIATTLAATRKHGFGGSHCLCHGQLGNLDYWLQYAEQTRDPGLQRGWREIAGLVLRQGQNEWRSGAAARHDLLGLMTGLAGIGYGLLRCASPEIVPSVLCLKLP